MVAPKKQPKQARKQVKRAPTKTKLRKKRAPQPANQPEIKEVSGPVVEYVNPALDTTIIDEGSQDRMLRYKRNPRCPECDAHPVICTIRRISYKAFRCRMCGHRWEVYY